MAKQMVLVAGNSRDLQAGGLSITPMLARVSIPAINHGPSTYYHALLLVVESEC